ncbi:hypothetical protein ES703_92009 [subsurface metagenome]
MADYEGAYYINIETGTVRYSLCAKCTDNMLKAYEQSGKGGLVAMADKVVKIPEELYRKVKAKSDGEGISMAKALGTIVDGKPMPEDIEVFIPSCAVELGVKMPKDYRWIKPLTEVLPVGLRGKLEPYAEVLDCAEAKAELKKLAEEHLGEVSEVSEGEVSEGESEGESESEG